MDKPIHPKLLSIIPIAKAVAETFGSNCEVVIHDFRNMENSIVAIFNGHVTGRTIDILDVWTYFKQN